MRFSRSTTGGFNLRHLLRVAVTNGGHLCAAVVSRLPGTAREPIEDLINKGKLLAGLGKVIPAQEFEDFLVAELEHLRHDTGASVVEGDYLEFGVYVGTSIGAAVRAFDRAGISGCRFVGFDSFQGLPPNSEADGWRSGEFRASRKVAQWNLSRQGLAGRVELVEGWFDQTCTRATVERLQLRNVLVAMIDCDTYTSSKLALDFVEPLLAPHSLLIFDDWYAANPDGTLMEGQRKAFHELLERHPGIVADDIGRPGFYGQAFRISLSTEMVRPDAAGAGPGSAGVSSNRASSLDVGTAAGRF